VNVQIASDAIWAALGALTLALVASAHLPRSRVERLSGLLHRVEATRVGYAAVVLGWMWLGWHFFAR
jgi:uncharacterized protein DUF6186